MGASSSWICQIWPLMDATMQLSSQADFIPKTDALWYPMNANWNLISTIRSRRGSYCPANFINIDPLMDATTRLFPLKLMPYWWPFPADPFQILNHSTLHGCHYAANSHRIDAPLGLICKLIPATLVHGWVKGALFRGVGFSDSLTELCWPCWPIGGEGN